jgi:hypothetical protein
MTLLNTPRIDSSLPIEPEWYAFRREQRSAALRFTDLRQMVERHVLRKEDLIWRPGWDQWVSAQEIPGLFPGHEQTSARSYDAKTLPVGGHAAAKKTEKRTLKERARDETKTFLLMFIYLWLIFGMFALHESVVLEKQGVDYQSHGFAFINALVLGKVMLLAEGLHLGRRFETKAPYYTILMKSVLFALAFLCFHVLEHVAIGLWNGEVVSDSIPSIGAGGLAGAVIVSAIMAIALIPYFAFKEIEKLTGDNELLAQIFGRKSRLARN